MNQHTSNDSADRRVASENVASNIRNSGPRSCSACVWLATGLGVGFSPVAPGTLGALWGLPLTLAIHQAGQWYWQLPIIVAVCLVGVPISSAAARSLGEKDPSAVVLDEIASVPIVFLFVANLNATTLIVGFVLHRLFDVTKPPPIGRIERFPAGLGIMADDWMAGVYACAVLHVLLWIGPWQRIGG